MTLSQKPFLNKTNMLNLKSSNFSMNLITSVSKYGRKTTKLDLSNTESQITKSANKENTIASKNLSSTSKKPKKCTNKNNINYDSLSDVPDVEISVFHNSSSERLTDLEIRECLNSVPDDENRKLHSKLNKKNVTDKTKLRCRKRIDYTQMLRGSSLGNDTQAIVKIVRLEDQSCLKNYMQPVVKLTSLENQIQKPVSNQTDDFKELEPSKQHPVYTQNTDSRDDIRPSQVYEFNFDADCESKLQKQFKKEAKVLKKFIRGKNGRKIDSQAIKAKKKLKKIPVRVAINLSPKKVQKSMEISKRNEIFNNNTPVSDSTKTHQSTPTQKSVVNTNNLSIDHIENCCSDNSFRNTDSAFKKPQSTPACKTIQSEISKDLFEDNDFNDRSNFELNQNAGHVSKSVVNTNNLSIDQTGNYCVASSFRNTDSAFKKPQSTPARKTIQSEISKDMFEDNDRSNFELHENVDDVSKICDDFDEILQPSMSESMNQSTPWRVVAPSIRKEKFFYVKNSSLPSYNQEITIKPQNISTASNVSNSKQISNEKKRIQSSMLSFIQSSKSVQKANDESQIIFGGDIINSPTELKSVSVNISESSASDISIVDKLDSLVNKENLITHRKNTTKRVNFQQAITSSPVTRRNVLREKNGILSSEIVHPRVQNLDDRNKENVYLERNENDSSKSISELENSVEDSSNSYDFFGFTSFEQMDKRESKKPARFSLKNIKNVLPIKDTTTSEPVIELEDENIAEKIDLINDENALNNVILDNSYNLFDEPRYTNYVRKSYAPSKRSRKRKVSESDHENDEIQRQPKARKNKKLRKEEVEFKNWAKQFNSMCDEVEKEELVIE